MIVQKGIVDDRIKQVDPVFVDGVKVKRVDSDKRTDGRTDIVFNSAKDAKKLEEAVDKLNKVLEIFNVERKYVIDDKTKEVVVKLIDKNTGEVVDQIPPEKALERYYEMQKFIGLLFNKRV